MKLKTYITALAMLCITLQASAQHNTITVSTAAQFVEALGPDRTIIIATDQPLNITEAIDQKVAEGTLPEGETYYTPEAPVSATAQVTYASNTDGNTLQVRGCNHLTIRSARGRATLLATPRYANVLEFIDCNDLTLENLVMGHTQDGYCDKGVLELDRCNHVTINDCDLYGCGTEGFVIDGCHNVTVNRTTVHDCTYYTMHVVRSNLVRFNDCIFRDNKESAVYNKDSKVTLKNSLFEDNCSDSDNGSKKNGGAVYSHYTLKVDNCNFVNNSADKGGAIFADYDATVTNSIFTGNSAAANGGAIMFDYRGWGSCETLTLNESKFTGNTAGSDGGAIFCDSMNYLTMSDVEIRNNTAGSNGGGLYCQKGSSSSCDPDISGKITIIDNQLTNGTKSNAFLGENKTSKCVFKITDNIDPSSRIGVTSNTNDGDLDICKIWKKDAYKNTANVFSYDTDKYKINRYTHWYSDFWWVEIVKK
nr:right-handed parallel beta-helix repeat-containing protein [uncultured Ruminococcus sp.]